MKFEFEGFVIEALPVGDNGDHLFDALLIAKALGYKDPHKAVKQHVDEDDWVKRPVIDSLGRKQAKTYVREPGMWALILRANSPAAKRLQRFVSSDVLPALRKYGHFDLAQAKIAALLGEHIRPWVALFGPEYWSNLDRLYQVTRPDPERKPRFYAGCVQLVYETFDQDIHSEMRNRVPKPQKAGIKQHQSLNDVGRECMQRHIARHVGLMDSCSSGPEYKALVRQVFGKQMKLPLRGALRLVSSQN